MKAIVEIDFGDRQLPEIACEGKNKYTCDVCPFSDYESGCHMWHFVPDWDGKCFLRENDKVTIKAE